MKEKVAIGDLRHGMFVAELDRPWLETPFLLQGFLLEDDTQMGELRKCCKFVFVDRARSVGPEFAAPAENAGVPEPDRHASGLRTVRVMGQGSERRPEFFEVLRFIHSQQVAGDPSSRAASSPFPQGKGPLPAGPRSSRDPRSRQELAAEIRSRLGQAAGSSEEDGGLFAYATSWLRPLADWLRRDSSDGEGAAPAGLAAQAESVDRGDGPILVYKEETALEDELVTAHPLYQEAQKSVEHLIQELEDQRTPDLAQVRASVAGLVGSVVRNPDALIWLNRLKRTDRYSYDHALEVSVLLMVAGRQIGLSEPQLNMLGTAGLLQDLGKIGLPHELLHKRGRITLEEFDLLKTHVGRSLLILNNNSEIPPALVDIVEKHHERIDGSGYPRGLAKGEIGLFAEMAGLADSYCAMTNDRTYRKALSSQQALERINRMRDVKFSGKVVDLFIQSIGLYPIGTLVKLNSGEVAVVIAQNRVRRLKPKVMVLLGPDKTPNRYPPTLDLLYDPPSPKGKPYRILRALPPKAYGIDPRDFYLA